MNKIVLIGISLLALVACEKPADIASRNLSTAADNFEVPRRIIFYNGITDSYMLKVEGLCSLGNDSTSVQVSFTCKDGINYKKYFLGLSDNVTYFVEQLDGVNVSTFHTRVMFRPQSILPDVDAQGSVNELTTNPN